MIYTIEVEVAVARPPSPENIRKMWVIVVVDPELPSFLADCEANLVALTMAESHPHVVMATGSRILSLVL